VRSCFQEADADPVEESSIDEDRLTAASDCGLGILGKKLALKKPSNMCTAAKVVWGMAGSGKLSKKLRAVKHVFKCFHA
jgi:hypothetical protein